MKLLLTSTGITNNSLQEKLYKMVGRRPSDITVAYVTTALNTNMQPNKRWAVDNIKRLDDMNIANIDIVDIAAVPNEMLRQRLEQAQIIYVEGGDPMYLLDEVKKANLVELLKTTFSDKVYVGCSAGSSIFGQVIIKSTKEEPWYKTADGLGEVNFSIRPHYSRGDRTVFDDKFIQNLTKELNTSIYAIDDQTGIVIEDEKLSIVSEGKWKKFEA